MSPVIKFNSLMEDICHPGIKFSVELPNVFTETIYIFKATT